MYSLDNLPLTLHSYIIWLCTYIWHDNKNKYYYLMQVQVLFTLFTVSFLSKGQRWHRTKLDSSEFLPGFPFFFPFSFWLTIGLASNCGEEVWYSVNIIILSTILLIIIL